MNPAEMQHVQKSVQDTRILQDSAYTCYTSSGYRNWKDQVIPLIRKYQQDMQGLNQQRIRDYQRLSDDVVETVYEDGTRVYVNYGRDDYRQGGLTVPARDYLVERGNRQ